MHIKLVTYNVLYKTVTLIISSLVARENRTASQVEMSWPARACSINSLSHRRRPNFVVLNGSAYRIQCPFN